MVSFANMFSLVTLYYGLAFIVVARILYGVAMIFWTAYFSPLAKIPNAHPSAPLSSIWILWQKFVQHEHRVRAAAHQKLGPIIRLGPQELSIDCIEDGIRTAYGSWEKHSWYTDALQGNTSPYMLTLLSRGPHAQRRRMVASIYSKTSVMNSLRIKEFLEAAIDGDLMGRLARASATTEALEMVDLSKSVYLDISTSWIFGLDLMAGFINNEEARREILIAFITGSADFFLRGEMASLAALLSRLGLRKSKHSTFDEGSYIQNWISKLCSDAELGMTEKSESYVPRNKSSEPTIYELLRQGLKDSGVSPEEMERSLHAECLDHIIASYEVSGVVLTYLMYEMSLRPTLQRQLRAEILSLGPLSEATPQDIEALGLLDAVLLETMRLHPAVPGPWPRVVPAGGARLGSFNDIPAGVKVSASPFSLHMHAEIFPQPKQWRPERWLHATKEDRSSMMKWMWQYGSGARGCIGNHFANRSLKHTVTRVYREFETKICDHGKMEDADSFIAGPSGGYLKLYFQPAQSAVQEAAI